MLVFRGLIATALCGIMLAQQQPEPKPAETEEKPYAFVTSVDVVTSPVTVFDRDGGWVHGLQPHEFHLFDNDKEQNIKVDVTYVPISIVIVVQTSSRVEGVLPQIQKIGNLIQPLVIGDQGEAAVVAYDHRVRVMQEFTSDPEKVSAAVKKLTPGSMSSRMVDGVYEAARLLRSRPSNRRRIILLVGETRDYGSQGRNRETLLSLQLNNIVLYSVDVSRVLSTLTAKQPAPRPDAFPPASRPLPGGVAGTPHNVMQTYGTQGGRAEFIPLMVELLRDVKAVFKDNPVELFTKGTGGQEYGFVRQRGLEDAVTRIGEELHSQYLVTYNPNNKEEGGFHKIVVQIAGHPDYKVLTRPGYWLAVKQ